MPYTLKGRNALITGSSRGLGALVAEKLAAEGCNVAINYNQSKDRAEALAKNIIQVHHVEAIVLQGDVGLQASCERLVIDAAEGLGGLDIVISNAGWTKMVDFGDLNALTEDQWDKCWAVNVKSNMHLLRTASPIFNDNPQGGVFLITASIAGMAPQGSSMAYSVSKAAALHLMKCLATTQGPKIRVNAISPGLLLTDWGNTFSAEKIKGTQEKAVLKKETDLDDCADAFVMAAKNSSLTGQNIQIDSGLVIR